MYDLQLFLPPARPLTHPACILPPSLPFIFPLIFLAFYLYYTSFPVSSFHLFLLYIQIASFITCCVFLYGNPFLLLSSIAFLFPPLQRPSLSTFQLASLLLSCFPTYLPVCLLPSCLIMCLYNEHRPGPTCVTSHTMLHTTSTVMATPDKNRESS